MNKFLNNFSSNSRTLKNTIVIGSFAYGVFFFIFTLQGIPPNLILRDLAQICDAKLGLGSISTLGIILWIGVSTIIWFIIKSGLLRNTKYYKFFISGGVLSTMLAIDDLFLIHDKFINQEIIFSFYLIFAIYIVKSFFDQILQLNSYLLIVCFALFGFSILIDIGFQESFPSIYTFLQIIEEGFKFLGICCWSVFWWDASNIILRNKLKGKLNKKES